MLTPRQALTVLPAEAALLNAAGLAAPASPSWFRRAIQIAPDQPEPHANLSAALLSAGDVEEARREVLLALVLAPDNAEAWNNLGNALLGRRDFDAALAAVRRARRVRPDFTDACINEGGLLLDIGAMAAGERLSRLAVILDPGSPGGWNNLGNGLLLNCRLAEADDVFGHAEALAPDDAQIRFNHAAILLKQGRFAEGWRAYEARRLTPAAKQRRRTADPPDWPGGDPAGKTLLLSTEQGYGDALQFSRFAVWMAQRGARVIVRTDAALVRLLRSLPGIAAVIAEDDPVPPCDFHLPLMSLPALQGEMPVAVPYLFADPQPWRDRLADLPGRKIGLAWSGNPRPGQRTANLLDRRRSLTRAHFDEIAALPGISLISLQKEEPFAELGDFADTASLVMALDLVISVDTAVAHLAGALGKPVCILSRFDGCWRWLQGRDDTPWYPGARLFRQERPGDWSAPLAALRKHIVTF